jgi:hypothetical protein
MENLRYMLYQYRSKTSLYFGHRYTRGVKGKGHTEGFMAGGGYILSKKALRKLVEEIIPQNKTNCIPVMPKNQTLEDKYTGEVVGILNSTKLFTIPQRFMSRQVRNFR